MKPAQRSNKIYESQLLLKDRGYPLWNPRPIPYSTEGIRVGDVGIINPYGGFDFLFNIRLPHDDPINPSVLPDGFVPIYPPLESRDVRKVREFNSGSFLASPSIAKTYCNNESAASGLVFESSNPLGAILTMPDGADHEELVNVSAFKYYFTKHIKNWYKFVNGHCGREAENGDIHLVVGSDKTTTWGMAVFSNPQQTRSRLKFRLDERQRTSSGCKYVWEHSEINGTVQVGPDDGENEELGTPPRPLRNQCLFIRTLNFMLAGDEWEKLNSALLAARCQEGSSDSGSNPGLSVSPSHSRGTSSSPTSLGTPNPTHYGRQQAGEPPGVGEEGSLSATRDPILVNNFTPSPPTIHPSKILNRFLLSQKPHAIMAVTRDRDWYSLLSDEDMAFPDASTLVQRAQIHNDIYEDGGVVQLRLRGRDRKSIDKEMEQIAELRLSLASGRTSLHVYLFGDDEEPGQSGTLQAAISYLRHSISLPFLGRHTLPLMPGRPDRLLILDDLLGLLRGEFVCEDMQEESIPSLWDQLGFPGADVPSRIRIQCLLRLGNALQRRYSRLGLIDDLEDAIHCYNQAASLSLTFEVHHQQLDASLGLLSSICQRYLTNGQLEDLITLKSTLEQQKEFDIKTMLRPFEDQLRMNKFHGRKEELKPQGGLSSEGREMDTNPWGSDRASLKTHDSTTSPLKHAISLILKMQPTEEELNLADDILAHKMCEQTGVLSSEAAIDIFQRSGLPSSALREIWTIADQNQSGFLSKEDLTIAIRLIGWAQAGEVVKRALLDRPGPLPTFKGFSKPTQYPPVVAEGPNAPIPYTPPPYGTVAHSRETFLGDAVYITEQLVGSYWHNHVTARNNPSRDNQGRSTELSLHPHFAGLGRTTSTTSSHGHSSKGKRRRLDDDSGRGHIKSEVGSSTKDATSKRPIASGRVVNLDRSKRQKASVELPSDDQKCLGCGTMSTPQWRRGPAGPRTFCNACDVHGLELMMKHSKEQAGNLEEGAVSSRKQRATTGGVGQRQGPGDVVDEDS